MYYTIRIKSWWEKLLCHFCDKKNCVVHHKILKLDKDLGLNITKIHRGIKFSQSHFMGSYIKLSSEQRQIAKHDFEKVFGNY
jgi:hypothetical protein